MKIWKKDSLFFLTVLNLSLDINQRYPDGNKYLDQILKAYILHKHTSPDILILVFLSCWIFHDMRHVHWSWMISVFLACQFELDTGPCGFCGCLSDLGWGWRWSVLEPWLLKVKGLPFQAEGKLTRQAWVSQWQAPGRPVLHVHGRLSSCSCMTLTAATTRQAALLSPSWAVLLCYCVTTHKQAFQWDSFQVGDER